MFNGTPTSPIPQPPPSDVMRTVTHVPNVHPLDGVMEEPGSYAPVNWYVRLHPYQTLSDGSSQVYYLEPSPYHFLRDPDEPVFSNAPMELCTGLARALYSRDRPDHMLPVLEHPEMLHRVMKRMRTFVALLRETPTRVSPELLRCKLHILAFAMYSCRICYSKKYHRNEWGTGHYQHNRPEHQRGDGMGGHVQL